MVAGCPREDVAAHLSWLGGCGESVLWLGGLPPPPPEWKGSQSQWVETRGGHLLLGLGSSRDD